MRALLFDGSLKALRNHPEPRRGPAESLIRVILAGICNTDLEIIKGYMGYSGVLGHEFVGVVEESDNAELIGKRVVGEINVSCNTCSFCSSGMRTHCPNRSVLGIMGRPGAMADFLTLPDGNLHEVPVNVPDEEAVFCEPLAAAFEIPEQIRIEAAHKVVVLGDGKLGLLVGQVMKLTGADVLLIGRHVQKLSLASAWAIRTLHANDSWPEQGADIVIDCTGSTNGFQRALEIVRPRGTIVVKTTTADAFSINLAPLVINELTILGSRCGPFAPALAALAARKINVAHMITRVFPLEQAAEAFELAARPDALKVLLKI